MRIEFKCRTNKDYVAINTLIFKLGDSTEIAVDRDETEYDIENGRLFMTWNNCYLWSINNCNVFGCEGKYIKGNYELAEFKRLVQNASFTFELEEDVKDDDYDINILEITIE